MRKTRTSRKAMSNNSDTTEETLKNLTRSGVTVMNPTEVITGKNEDNDDNLPEPIPRKYSNLIYGDTVEEKNDYSGSNHSSRERNLPYTFSPPNEVELPYPELVNKFGIDLLGDLNIELNDASLARYFRNTTGDVGFIDFQLWATNQRDIVEKQLETEKKFEEQIKNLQKTSSEPTWKKYFPENNRTNETKDTEPVLDDDQYEYSSESDENDIPPTKTERNATPNKVIGEFLNKHLLKIQNSTIPNLLEEFKKFGKGESFDKTPVETFAGELSKYAKFDKDVSILDGELSKYSQFCDGNEDSMEVV